MSLLESHPAIHDHKGKSCPVTGKTYEYCPPQPGDSRSACPALNTMANHGYISRDGKNLSALDLIRGLKAAMASPTPLLFPFRQYAPIDIDGVLVDKLIQDVEPSSAQLEIEKPELLMNATDVARSRVRREAECRKPDAVHAEIARGEMAIILGVWEKKTQGKAGIPAEWMKRWIGEERLPDGWNLTMPGKKSPPSTATNSIEKLPL
ncbi:Chloroperoxidase [Cyathus striatus]|nr:Chloroperoxidase [Cyathus striatus]